MGQRRTQQGSKIVQDTQRIRQKFMLSVVQLRNTLLKNFLGNEVLDDNSLQQLVNMIQSELDVVSSLEHNTDLPLPPSGPEGTYHRRCLQALRYLSTKYRVLPSSLVIPDVKTIGHLPVAGGGFADIWRGTLGNQTVCLKVLRLIVEPDEEVREKIRKRFCNEAILWRQLKHPNILPLLGISVKLFEPSFCLISPWMENKDVITFLKQNPSHSRHKVLQDIAAGVLYLHSRSPPITHGDIRGANILITDDLRCCLTDFGLALITANSQSWTATTTSSMKGAIRWMAPELFNHDDSVPVILDHPSRDIYAFGCTIIEILTLQYPFHDHKTDYAVLASLMLGKRPHRPQNDWCSDSLWHITTSCWKQDHSARPTAFEVYALLQQCSSPDDKPPLEDYPSKWTTSKPFTGSKETLASGYDWDEMKTDMTADFEDDRQSDINAQNGSTLVEVGLGSNNGGGREASVPQSGLNESLHHLNDQIESQPNIPSRKQKILEKIISETRRKTLEQIICDAAFEAQRKRRRFDNINTRRIITLSTLRDLAYLQRRYVTRRSQEVRSKSKLNENPR